MKILSSIIPFVALLVVTGFSASGEKTKEAKIRGDAFYFRSAEIAQATQESWSHNGHNDYRFLVGSDIESDYVVPVLEYSIPPDNPPGPGQPRLQGTVTMEAVLDNGGYVVGIRVTKSSDRRLELAALNAVTQWKFLPGRYKGKKVMWIVTASVEFKA